MGLDLLGHCCYVLVFLGQWQIGRRCIGGWVFRFLGDVGWVAVGMALGLSSIWAWGTMFAYMDVRAFLAWRKAHAAEVSGV